MLRIIFLFCGLWIANMATAQFSADENEVRGLFDKPQKIKWIKSYQGRVDDFMDIAVTLAFDGKNCRGKMTYLNSKEVLWWSGGLKNGRLQLQEINSNMEVCGNIEGNFEENELWLNWIDLNQTQGMEIHLKPLPSHKIQLTNCGSNRWIRQYRGIISNEPVEILLQRTSRNQLQGNIYFFNQKQTYTIRGDFAPSRTVKLKIQNNFSQLKGNLEGIIQRNGQISANFFAADGHRSPTLFSIQQELEVDCEGYADYATSYDITFPKSDHTAYNAWITQVTSQWVKTCQTYAHQAKLMNTANRPTTRASIRASAWTEVELSTDRVLSSFITFSNTWTLGMEGKALNYDLSTNKEITATDIFKADFDYSQFVRTYLNKQINNHDQYKDVEFRKWLATQEFPHFTLRRDGICFRTHFDTIYGYQKITIPYSVMQAYIKVDSPIRFLNRN